MEGLQPCCCWLTFCGGLSSAESDVVHCVAAAVQSFHQLHMENNRPRALWMMLCMLHSIIP